LGTDVSARAISRWKRLTGISLSPGRPGSRKGIISSQFENLHRGDVMPATGLDVFDTTLQKTHTWLNELMEIMGSDDKHRAYSALRAVLHALRDRLTVEEVAQLGAQLPMLIRGFYYEGWDPTAKPVRERRREQFLVRVEQPFLRTSPVDPEPIAVAVFKLLSARISQGEIEDVRHVLPAEIRDMWP
jgi:uncharacterized protein (DUF2267 family)